MKWSEEEIEFLKNNYNKYNRTELSKYINRAPTSISAMAFRLNLSKSKSDVGVLLNDDLVSFYWIGFLLADGSFNGKYLKLRQCLQEYEHLEKFCKLTNSKLKKYELKKFSSFSKNSHYLYMSCGDIELIPKIMEKFDIHKAKTYNPPDFNKYKFTQDQMISLIIGFIDGDGNISLSYGDRPRITIALHNSWSNNLKYINEFLHNLINEIPNNKIIVNKYSILNIYKKTILKLLKKFSITNNLPILDRKWNNINILSIPKIKPKEKYRGYYKLIDPNNNVFVINNLTKFCKEHKLNRTGIKNLISGKYKYYKGWDATKIS